MTYTNLQQYNLTAQLYLKFLLITEQEVPFMNTSKATADGGRRTADKRQENKDIENKFKK